MALRLWYRTTPGTGAWTEVNLVSAAACGFKFEVSYSHPQRLSWTMLQAQHTTPIPYLADIAFVDEDHYDPAGASDPDDPDTFASITFEGHVHEIQPTKSLELSYVAYDPTKRAGDRVGVIAAPATSVPRLVFNAKIEQDDDYAYSRQLDATISEIIQVLLGDQVSTLRTHMAAPPSSGDAWVSSDLTPFDFESQEKIVFETEGIRSAIDRCLGWYPGYRILFEPGGNSKRKWRFHDLDSGSQVTLTLNDFSGKKVLTLNLQRSIDQRYTAVEIRGPLKLNYGIAAALTTTSAGASAPSGQTGTLIEKWTLTQENQLIVNGPEAAGAGPAARKWQITNAARRALGRILPNEIAVPYTELGWAASEANAYKTTKAPSLLVTYDLGETWETVEGITLDVATGIVEAPKAVVRHIGGVWTLPDNVVFHYSFFDSVLFARYPSAGYDGTAYSVLGIENLFQRFDESLVTGWDKNDVFVTETARVAEFEKLAQNIHDAAKDIIYTGGLTLQGLDYDFVQLGTRINLAGKDGDGGSVTTGWESANMILTDVEYDYETRITTLQFSNDMSEYTETNPELLKQFLKIEALEAIGGNILLQYFFNGQLIYSSNIDPTQLSGDGIFRPLEPLE